MKKIFTVFAAVLMVLSFAGAAFAIHSEIPADTQAIVAKGSTQINIGGEIRVRGWYYDNLGPTFGAAVNQDPQDSNSKANYDQRVRLTIDAVVSPNVSGKIMLETGNSDSATTDIYAWGRLNQKPNATTTFQEAWIMYKGDGLFGFPAFVKVGHMPLKLSHGVFFDNTQYGDDAIVFAMDPTKELHIGLLTIKASEFGKGGSTATGSNTNDLDAYVGLFTYKIAPTHTIGLNYTYINESDIDLQFQNAAIHADGKVGNFGYAAEADFQFGDVFSGSSSADFGGIGVALKANYQFTPEFNLRGGFAWGSGDDDSDDNDIDEFQTLVGGIQHYTFIYDYRAATAAYQQVLAGTPGTRTAGTGIANTTVYNLGFDYKWNKDLTTKFDGYYLRASDSPKHVSKDIGIELNGQISYQIAKNLNYTINIGHMFTDDFYHDMDKEFGKGNVESKDVTIVNNVLTLSF